jgi:hypothetical protein
MLLTKSTGFPKRARLKFGDLKVFSSQKREWGWVRTGTRAGIF